MAPPADGQVQAARIAEDELLTGSLPGGTRRAPAGGAPEVPGRLPVHAAAMLTPARAAAAVAVGKPAPAPRRRR
ncbi:hypothetical protein GCM10020254_10290 [Streptomyces goshikiensis]